MEKASLAQGKQILDLLSSASIEQIQNLVEGGDLIQIMMNADLRGVNREQFRQLLQVIANPYESEYITQAWFYPDEFTMPTLETQAQRLQVVLGFEPKWPEVAQNLPFPTGEFGADGIGLWPTLTDLGKLWDITDVYGAGYGELIAAVCTKINESLDMVPLVNYREGQLTQNYVRIVAEVLGILAPLEQKAERQGFNCLAMPVNLGDWGTKLCYSPRNALWQTLNLPPKRLAIEPVAGLSLVVAGTSILTKYGQQWKDFPGAQYNWSADGRWSRSLVVRFRDGRFKFDARDADYTGGDCGSLVGFPGVS